MIFLKRMKFILIYIVLSSMLASAFGENFCNSWRNVYTTTQTYNSLFGVTYTEVVVDEFDLYDPATTPTSDDNGINDHGIRISLRVSGSGKSVELWNQAKVKFIDSNNASNTYLLDVAAHFNDANTVAPSGTHYNILVEDFYADSFEVKIMGTDGETRRKGSWSGGNQEYKVDCKPVKFLECDGSPSKIYSYSLVGLRKTFPSDKDVVIRNVPESLTYASMFNVRGSYSYNALERSYPDTTSMYATPELGDGVLTPGNNLAAGGLAETTDAVDVYCIDRCGTSGLRNAEGTCVACEAVEDFVLNDKHTKCQCDYSNDLTSDGAGRCTQCSSLFSTTIYDSVTRMEICQDFDEGNDLSCGKRTRGEAEIHPYKFVKAVDADFSLEDSWGDGWNGNTLQFLNSTGAIENRETTSADILNDLNFATFTDPSNNDAYIVVRYNWGGADGTKTYPHENYYTIENCVRCLEENTALVNGACQTCSSVANSTGLSNSDRSACECDDANGYGSNGAGGCHLCSNVEGSTGLIDSDGFCVCDAANNFVSDGNGGCQCDIANGFGLDGDGGCQCDIANGFLSDGAGGCRACSSLFSTTINEVTQNDICEDFQIAANILECGEEYQGDNEVHPYQFVKGSRADFYLRDSWGDSWNGNTLQYLNSTGAIQNLETTRDDKSKVVEFIDLNFATFTDPTNNDAYIVVRYNWHGGYTYPDENYYTFENCGICSERNFGKVNGVCKACSNVIGSTGLLDSDGSACVCDAVKNFVSDGDGGCQCNAANNFVSDNAGGCQCDIANGYGSKGADDCHLCSNVEGSTGAITDGSCVCDAQNGYGSNGAGGCHLCSKVEGSTGLIDSDGSCVCDAEKNFLSDDAGGCQCNIANGYGSNGAGGCHYCPQKEGSTGFADSYGCVCDTEENFVPDGDGGCQCDAANNFVSNGADGCQCDAANNFVDDNAGGCQCDAANGFASDGNGGCVHCSSNTVPNDNGVGCICDTSQSFYGQPLQCEIRSDDCTKLHDNQYPMTVELDGVCLPLSRTLAESECGDALTDHGQNCVYRGPDRATGYLDRWSSYAFLMHDPPQHTFTLSWSFNSRFYVRLFKHRYRFTCVEESTTSCFTFVDRDGSLKYTIPNTATTYELDLTGDTEFTPDLSPVTYNKAGYYNFITVYQYRTLKIEKLDATCGDDGVSPVNPNFCQCGDPRYAPNSDGTACVCDTDHGSVSDGDGGCQCDTDLNFVADGAGGCQPCSDVEGSTGEAIDGTACQCDNDNGFGSNGDGGCHLCSEVEGSTGFIDSDGSCMCDVENGFVSNGADRCQCDAANGFASDGNGGCVHCSSNTVPNDNGVGCLCDTSQSFYGQPLQCNIRSDDCTQLHDNQYPMTVELDSVCVPLSRNIAESDCGDASTDHGTNCAYKGPDRATGYFSNVYLSNAFLMHDPPQHTFTLKYSTYSRFYVRLFKHRYRLTCPSVTTSNCFQFVDVTNGATESPQELATTYELDLTGDTEFTPDLSSYTYNRAGYYNFIKVGSFDFLKIEKLNATCGDNGVSPVNPNFCMCSDPRYVLNSDGTACECNVDLNIVADGAGGCRPCSDVEGSTGEAINGTACECDNDNSFVSDRDGGCQCDYTIGLISDGDGGCQACSEVEGSTGLASSDGSCVCDAANGFASDDDGRCQCDAANNFAADGNGGCVHCTSNTVPNDNLDGCICDTSQSFYGQPLQCEIRSDDCTKLHNNQYPMLMEVDGVCLPLSRKTIAASDCIDASTDHGTNCIYKGPDPATGYFNTPLNYASLLDDPPQHTFTLSTDINTKLLVRLFYYHYRFTCVQPSSNCYHLLNTNGNVIRPVSDVIDLSGGIEGGLVTATTGYDYNKESYYNFILLQNDATLKIEKLNATCGDDGVSPVNRNFCMCGDPRYAPNSDGTDCECNADLNLISDGAGGCQCDYTIGLISDGDGGCQACSNVRGSTGEAINATACECDTANNFVSDGNGGCQCNVNDGFLPDDNGVCQQCPSNTVVNDNLDGCICNVNDGFVPDGNGGCQQCPSNTVMNDNLDGCICDTSQSFYGQPLQCEIRSDDCTQLYTGVWPHLPMLMELDGVCVPLSRNIAGSACGDASADHGTNCIYLGPDPATGYHVISSLYSALMYDPPQHTFTITSDTYNRFFVRLFYHHYRLTCVGHDSYCFNYWNTELGNSNPESRNSVEIDLSGGIEGGLVTAKDGYDYNKESYYNIIEVRHGRTLKIEKLDATCGDDGVSPVNPNFCQCGDPLYALNSGGTACVCDTAHGSVSDGDGGCQCDTANNFISNGVDGCRCDVENGYGSDGAGGCHLCSNVEGSTGSTTSDGLCVCDVSNNFVYNGAGRCQACSDVEGSTGLLDSDGSACVCDAANDFKSDGAFGCQCEVGFVYAPTSCYKLLREGYHCNKKNRARDEGQQQVKNSDDSHPSSAKECFQRCMELNPFSFGDVHSFHWENDDTPRCFCNKNDCDVNVDSTIDDDYTYQGESDYWNAYAILSGTDCVASELTTSQFSDCLSCSTVTGSTGLSNSDGSACECDAANNFVSDGAGRCQPCSDVEGSTGLASSDGSCVCDTANGFASDDDGGCQCDASKNFVSDNAGGCQCDIENGYGSNGAGVCHYCPQVEGSTGLADSDGCVCDALNGFVSDGDGGCQCDAANNFVSDGFGGCKCDASNNVVSDGAGGCRPCGTKTGELSTASDALGICVCNIAQNYYTNFTGTQCIHQVTTDQWACQSSSVGLSNRKIFVRRDNNPFTSCRAECGEYPFTLTSADATYLRCHCSLQLECTPTFDSSAKPYYHVGECNFNEETPPTASQLENGILGSKTVAAVNIDASQMDCVYCDASKNLTVSSNGNKCHCEASNNFIPDGDGCYQCAEHSTVSSDGTTCECPNDGYFGEGEDCGPCNTEEAEVNTVRVNELCYNFNGSATVESIEKIQAIQNSLLQIQGECPISVE